MTTEQKQEIEYETVAIKVPKRIVDFLRAHEKDMNMTAKEYIEYNVVCIVRADIDALDVFFPSAKEVADGWKLNSIFKAIVNDEIV